MDLHGWITADLASVRSKLFDSVLALVPEDRWHEPADGGGTTIAGLTLHLARHQDLAVTTVLADRPPRFTAHAARLGLASAAPSAGLAEREDRLLTAAVTPAALVDYATEVFDATAAWLAEHGTTDLDGVPDTDRRLAEQGGLDHDDVPWLFGMWRDKPRWWLLQWPVIGHGHAHTGEAISIRNRMGLSPF